MLVNQLFIFLILLQYIVSTQHATVLIYSLYAEGYNFLELNVLAKFNCIHKNVINLFIVSFVCNELMSVIVQFPNTAQSTGLLLYF